VGLYLVREGEGEEDALPNLISRVRDRLGIHLPHIPRDGNWRKQLLLEGQVLTTCEQIRGIGTCEALLLTRDADNDDLPEQDCPRFSAPAMAHWVRQLNLPFPTAVVLFYKEYETLFLAGAGAMAGKEVIDSRGRLLHTISDDVTGHPQPEHPRDAKGWVDRKIVPGYKPMLFQTSVTRLLDLDSMEESQLPSYVHFERALRFLSEHLGEHGAVYPPEPM
jgi:hypothetical protein